MHGRSRTPSEPSSSTSREYRPEGYSEHDKLPIVYSSAYNISFYGLEKVHPFDAGKWGKVFDGLKRAGLLTDSNYHEPHEATTQELLLVHSPSYINRLKWSAYVATVTEVPVMALLPNFVVQRRVLRPFRYQTAGTIMVSALCSQLPSHGAQEAPAGLIGSAVAELATSRGSPERNNVDPGEGRSMQCMHKWILGAVASLPVEMEPLWHCFGALWPRSSCAIKPHQSIKPLWGGGVQLCCAGLVSLKHEALQHEACMSVPVLFFSTF